MRCARLQIWRWAGWVRAGRMVRVAPRFAAEVSPSPLELAAHALHGQLRPSSASDRSSPIRLRQRILELGAGQGKAVTLPDYLLRSSRSDGTAHDVVSRPSAGTLFVANTGH